MKKIIIMTSLMLSLIAPPTFSQEAISINYQLPSQFVAGETTEFKWQFSEINPKKPVFIYLQNVETELFSRVGVARNNESGYTTYQWNIPSHLKGNYRLRLHHQIDGNWIRRRSQVFTIQPTSSEVDEISDTNNVGTSVTVETEKEKTSPSQVIESEFYTQNITAREVAQEGLSLVAQYSLNAELEPWNVNKLTVVNDTENDGFEVDNNESTSIIEKVYIRYKNEADELQERSSSLNGNLATFSNLNFYIPRNESGRLEIWAKVKSPTTLADEESGKTFRLGLQSQSSSDRYFEAIGVFSNGKISNPFSFGNTGPQPKEFIIRKSAPIFVVDNSSNSLLIEGSQTVFEFSVEPSGNSPIALSRLVFDVNQSNVGTLNQIEFLRAGSRLTAGDESSINQAYLVWDAGSTSCFAHKANTGMNCVGGTQGNGKLIVTFTQDEMIAGKTDYKIKANVGSLTGEASLQFKLATGDEENKPTIGGIVTSTGAIYNGSGSNELFSTATQLINEATDLEDRNIIWTDQPLKGAHQYPTITPAATPSVSTNNSNDYTNGYLLKVDTLNTVTLEN